MYAIKFKPNIDGCGRDEVDEKIQLFEYNVKEIIDKGVSKDYDYDENGEWYICKTENLDELLKNICISFEINEIIVTNLNPIIHDI